MSKVKNLWMRFNQIEAELEHCSPNTDIYRRKRRELLMIYNEIQEAENDLTSWQTGKEVSVAS